MLDDDPLAADAAVGSSVFFGEGLVFAFLLRMLTVGMQLLDALVARVGLPGGIRVQCDPGFLEQVEVVLPSVGKAGAENLLCLLVRYDLALEGVPFLLAGVVLFLSFFGRSMGVSATSTRTTSNCASLFWRAFRPGSAKRSSLMSVSSTQRLTR